jgi:hypothetical protein
MQIWIVYQLRSSIRRMQTHDAADSSLFSARAWICDNLRTGIFVFRYRYCSCDLNDLN